MPGTQLVWKMVDLRETSWQNIAMTHLHPDRLFPASEPAHSIARELYPEVADLPLICPHGHTDPAWFANNQRFSNPAALFLTPDHYVLRMLRST
jgi:glucuronate isomerase